MRSRSAKGCDAWLLGRCEGRKLTGLATPPSRVTRRDGLQDRPEAGGGWLHPKPYGAVVRARGPLHPMPSRGAQRSLAAGWSAGVDPGQSPGLPLEGIAGGGDGASPESRLQ